MASVVLTPSQAEVLTLAQVHQQCRIDVGDEDAYLENILIPAVCALFESETRCRLLATLQEDRLPCWPRTGRIDLTWGPVRSVSGITYLDSAGQLQTFDPDAYQVDAVGRPGSIYLVPGSSTPDMKTHPAALRVRYVAGLADSADDVPANVRLWLLLHVGHFWSNREAGFASSGNDMKPLLFASALIADYCLAVI